MISVYYDGKCGLCAREIGYFKKRIPRTPIMWHDIARNPESLAGTGVDQADALMFMRVKDAEGRLHSSVDAFIILWSQFKGWRTLASLVGRRPIRPLAEKLYAVFAARRFAAYPHCQIAARQRKQAG
ncbi:thiol-disulfide oxidoreductase DCC family protein [Roseibium sp.]|uniref:thiol-disulfide oxidoreductase DCC family protein n=1 Tax=Roseibium sp. TaxID=1936156 RepID=UPI003A96D3FE